MSDSFMPVENVTPYASGECKRDQVKQIFDTLAHGYDRLNRILSLGIDRSWRYRALRPLREHSPARVLDMATGTADLAILAARLLPEVQVTGIDLSNEMLAIGRTKIANAGLTERITLQQGDCLDSALPDELFDVVMAGFGVRNFASLSAGFGEMYRVLAPGGQLVILELSKPITWPWRVLYRFYLRYVITCVGRLLTGHAQEYAYLPASIEQVPQREGMCALLRDAGFSACHFSSYTFGICTCYRATRGESKMSDCPPSLTT